MDDRIKGEIWKMGDRIAVNKVINYNVIVFFLATTRAYIHLFS